ncbi:MAG: flagellar motor protein MotB, partial [Pedobacter sp.]
RSLSATAFHSGYKLRSAHHLLLCIVAALLTAVATQAQSKSPLQLADQYFAAGEYFTAAGLYEQFLHPAKRVKTSGDFPLISRRRRTGVTITNVSPAAVLYKQAESYRLAHYWKEAETAYQSSYTKNKEENIDALYWLAVAQRSQGNFTAAKENLTAYLLNGVTFKNEAQQELNTLQFIQQQTSRPDTILYKLHNVPASSGTGLYAPVRLSGNQYLVTSTEADSTRKDGVNPYHSKVYTATLTGNNFENLQPVEIPIADLLANQGSATLSADGNTIYFTQWKLDAGGKLASIYSSRKQANGWSTPASVSGINAPGTSNKQPFCSADGKFIFFSSNR